MHAQKHTEFLASAALLLVCAVASLAQPATRPTSAPSDATLQQDLRSFGGQSMYRQGNIFSMTDAELNDYIEIAARTNAENFRKRYKLTAEQDDILRKQVQEAIAESRIYVREKIGALREDERKYGSPRVLTREEAQTEEGRENLRRLRDRSAFLQGLPIHARKMQTRLEKILPPEQIAATRPSREVMERGEAANRMRELASPLISLRQHYDLAPEQEAKVQKVIDEVTAQGGDWLEIRKAVAKILPAEQVEAAQIREKRNPQLLQGSPLGSWERYVQNFIKVYDLDETQQATAHSVLREMIAQRDRYNKDHEKDKQDARNIPSSAERLQRLQELAEPIKAMFAALQQKLEPIPTAAQRAVIEKARYKHYKPPEWPRRPTTATAPADRTE